LQQTRFERYGMNRGCRRILAVPKRPDPRRDQERIGFAPSR